MKRVTARPPAALALLLPGLLLLAGCASWETTRSNVVDPIHHLLHHDYPDAIEEMDVERLRSFFAEEAALAPTLELLAGFARVEHARGEIDRVLVDEDPVRARIRLYVDGVGAGGELRSLRQDKRFYLARPSGDAGWRIARDPPTPMAVAPRPPSHFVDEAALRGLWFQHEAAEVPDARGEPQKFVYGSGVAAADFDADGWDDVLLLKRDRIELFHNQQGFFTPVSRAWGLGEVSGAVPTAALPFDYDDDGRLDLLVAAEQGQPLLFHNEGRRFRRVEAHGLETAERTVAAAVADFDGDGHLDLYLANHENVYLVAPDLPDADNAEADQLFLGNGDGSFRDASRWAGIRNTGWSLSPVAADYDGDGDVDLFVGNDFGDDKLYRNDGSGRFQEVAARSGVDRPVASMSADWGDYDGDGDLDLFVAGMSSGSAWVLEVPEFRIRKVPWLVDLLFRPWVRETVRSWFQGNRFYENLGDGSFREIAQESDVAHNGWAWSSVWLDFDNDGRLDVYATNGFLSGPLEDDL